MRRTCIDACCLINLTNSGVLEAVVAPKTTSLTLQGLVEDELNRGEDVLTRHVNAGLVNVISGDFLLASEVQEIIDRYRLGVGESECIAIGKKLTWYVASDDRRARAAAVSELGKQRVTGSLGLLRDAVSHGSLASGRAYEAYLTMKRNGAFLPDINKEFFD